MGMNLAPLARADLIDSQSNLLGSSLAVGFTGSINDRLKDRDQKRQAESSEARDGSSMPMNGGNVTVDSSVQSSARTARKWKSFIDRDYLFRYPAGEFVVVAETPAAGGAGAVGQGSRRSENPIRGEVREANGKARVTVVQEQAAQLKQSLLQITDISQFGNLQEASRLLFPPGTKVFSAADIEFPQPAKDTGTLLGKIEREPVHVYRYRVQLPTSERAEVAVGILLGRVLLLGASSPEEYWEEESSTLKEIADSFNLLPR